MKMTGCFPSRLRIDAIIDDKRAKWQAINAVHDKQYEAIRQQFRSDIRATLTPEQQVKFDEAMKRLDEQRKKKPPTSSRSTD